jgi:hypothetical protein
MIMLPHKIHTILLKFTQTFALIQLMMMFFRYFIPLSQNWIKVSFPAAKKLKSKTNKIVPI